MTDGGWYDDPTGRFGKRWHDGARWTEHVVDAAGSVHQDPLQPAPAPPGGYQPLGYVPTGQYLPPVQQVQQVPPGQYLPPAGASYAAAPATPHYLSAGNVRYAPGAGVVASVLGLVGLVLSLFVINWDQDAGTSFLDLRRAANDLPDGVDLPTGLAVAVQYAIWGAFLLGAAAVVLAVLAGVPIPRTAAGNSYARVGGALVAGAGLVGQMIAMTQFFKGDPSPQAGAWCGLAGWALLLIGFVLGARRTTG